MKGMNPISLLIGYTLWHYRHSLISYLSIWMNFLWFIGHLFSFGSLLKTLFSPWKRMTEGYPHGGFHPSIFFQSLIVNTIMRIVGAIVRIVIILVGIVFIIIALLSGAVFFIVWLVMPLLIPLIIAGGVLLLI